MGKTTKLTTKEFIDRSVNVHGCRYDYKKSVYVNARTKVTITCKDHGDFEQNPAKHIKGSGCIKCVHCELARRMTSSKYEFIKSAIEVHNNKYDYTKADYISCNTKLIIICQEHGEFLQSPSNHTQGNGCPNCGKISYIRSRCKKSIDFIVEASNIHNNKYDYSKIQYNNNRIKIAIICPVHGQFKQSPSNHLGGRGCPNCVSYGFDKSKPAILYYLKINGGQAYKIGITNRTVNERFNNVDLKKIEIVKTWHYEIGAEAYEAEQKILNDYNKYMYLGINILQSGNTELFNSDILGLLSQ